MNKILVGDMAGGCSTKSQCRSIPHHVTLHHNMADPRASILSSQFEVAQSVCPPSPTRTLRVLIPTRMSSLASLRRSIRAYSLQPRPHSTGSMPQTQSESDFMALTCDLAAPPAQCAPADPRWKYTRHGKFVQQYSIQILD